MTDLQDKYAALDALTEAQAEVRKLKQALQDIAGSEAIPTAFEAWKWCKEVAIAALPSDQCGGAS